MPEDSSLLQQLIRDLSAKVDTLPTRHELDALNATVADLKVEFNRFVLVSEFNTYRDYADQRHFGAIRSLEDKMGVMVPRQEHEARWADENKRFDSVEALCEDHEDRVKEMELNRTPAWIRNAGLSIVTGLVSALITAFASHQLYTGQTGLLPVTTMQVTTPAASTPHH